MGGLTENLKHSVRNRGWLNFSFFPLRRAEQAAGESPRQPNGFNPGEIGDHLVQLAIFFPTPDRINPETADPGFHSKTQQRQPRSRKHTGILQEPFLCENPEPRNRDSDRDCSGQRTFARADPKQKDCHTQAGGSQDPQNIRHKNTPCEPKSQKLTAVCCTLPRFLSPPNPLISRPPSLSLASPSFSRPH